MGFGISSVFNKAKDVGGSVIHKAKDVGGSVVHKAKDVGGSAVHKAKDVGGSALHKAKNVGGDVVSFSKEAVEFKSKQEKNFANGVLDWGKDTVGTVATLVTHPVESAKAVGKLATNPVLNPIGGTAWALAHGKNPVKAYGDGLNDVKDIGSSLLDGYKETYKEHGIAGLAGRIAPDVVIAIASGGSGTAAKGAGEAGGKAVATTVAKDVAKVAAKDVAKEFIPGPEDIVSGSLDKDTKPNFIEEFIKNFSV